jgi:hypothetical protein
MPEHQEISPAGAALLVRRARRQEARESRIARAAYEREQRKRAEDEWMDAVVAAAPALSDEQIRRLAAMLQLRSRQLHSSEEAWKKKIAWARYVERHHLNTTTIEEAIEALQSADLPVIQNADPRP